MKKILQRHHASFANAFEGLFWALKTQPNFIIHLSVSILIVLAGLYVKVSYTEWLVIIMLIFTGLVIETINTAIEAATDAITKEWNQQIKIAKDVSAAAMLIFAIGAMVITALIFIPKLQALF